MPEFATAELLRTSLARFDAETKPGAIHTGRYRLRYRTWGEGKPVVFVHGLCDLSRSFAMVMAPLVEAGFRVIGYELANSLDDDANLGMYKHPDFAADLVALLDHLQLERVDIVGSSFGSTITLRSLINYPERFHRAALQGGFARRPLMRIERGLARLGRYWPWRMGDLPIRDQVMAKLELPMFEGCPVEVFRFLISNSGETPIRAAGRRALILDKLDLRPELHRIPHPVLMIGGDRDTIIPRILEQYVEDGVKDIRRVEFSPCGHYPQYTLPLPTARELIGFLN